MSGTLILALTLTGQVRACQTASSYRQTTYAAPVYQQTYAAPYKEVVAFVAVEQPEYYANIVGSQVRAELKAKAEGAQAADLAAKVGLLADAVGRLEARIGAGAPQPQPTSPPVTPDTGTPVVPTPPTPGPVTGPGVPPPPPVPQPSSLEAATTIMRNACSKCHTTPSTGGGGFNIFAADGSVVALSPFAKLRIDQQVYSGDMPKNAQKPLGAEDYSQLRAWIGEDQAAIEAAIKACEAKGTN